MHRFNNLEHLLQGKSSTLLSAYSESSLAFCSMTSLKYYILSKIQDIKNASLALTDCSHVNVSNIVSKIKYRLKLNSLVAFYQLKWLSTINCRQCCECYQRFPSLEPPHCFKNEALLVYSVPICTYYLWLLTRQSCGPEKLQLILNVLKVDHTHYMDYYRKFLPNLGLKINDMV